ncbi:hypothetical protein HWV62_10371 [Athelia sp. TMB]|nr:hypothetical protein HWV62_10371 [Athelia sp. TMB]
MGRSGHSESFRVWIGPRGSLVPIKEDHGLFGSVDVDSSLQLSFPLQDVGRRVQRISIKSRRLPRDMNHSSRAAGANPPHPPTQAIVDGLRWVSPVSLTLDRISPVAMRFKGSQHRLAGVTEEGVWRGLNWTAKADWFDLRVHWRGYLGVDVLKGQQDWRDSDELIVRVGEGYKLKASVAKFRGARINQLREHLEALEIVLYLNLEGIPYPAFVDTSPLLFLQANKRAVCKAMALSRLYYLDMIAFYRWVREAMDEELIYRGFDADYPPQEEWIRWMKLPTVGYLIDLHGDWRTHNLPMWKEHRVPVHYIWNEDVEANERF